MQTNPIIINHIAMESVNWIIVDLDGTLSDYTHRKHHIQRARGVGQENTERQHLTGVDWEEFNKQAIHDPIKPDIDLIVRMAAATGHRIAIITGRNTNYASITIQWLDRHRIPCDLLLMRDYGDWRPDVEVKRELYWKYLDKPHIKVRFCLEDRDGVTELWRSLGMTCLQVMKGEY